jgi:NTP pyrophosphatase (non-canonical NTP hydrolase)
VATERKGHELPHPSFEGWADDERTQALYEPIFLPDYVTLRYKVNGQSYEVQVHPSRADLFLEEQRAIHGEIEVLEPVLQQERCLTINECQAIQSFWENGAGVGRDTFEQTARMGEEYDELLEATSEYELKPTPEKAREAGKEAIDVIIIALGIIDRLGLNADGLFREKMEQNFYKYPIGEVTKLVEQGLSVNEAMIKLKKGWNGD